MTIRVPDDLKHRMDAVDVNWSEVLREAIDEHLRRARREGALGDLDRLRQKIHARTGSYSKASEEVIRWRRLH